MERASVACYCNHNHFVLPQPARSRGKRMPRTRVLVFTGVDTMYTLVHISSSIESCRPSNKQICCVEIESGSADVKCRVKIVYMYMKFLHKMCKTLLVENVPVVFRTGQHNSCLRPPTEQTDWCVHLPCVLIWPFFSSMYLWGYIGALSVDEHLAS